MRSSTVLLPPPKAPVRSQRRGSGLQEPRFTDSTNALFVREVEWFLGLSPMTALRPIIGHRGFIRAHLKADVEMIIAKWQQCCVIRNGRAKAAGVDQGRRPSIDGSEVKSLHDQGKRPSQIAKQLRIARASVYRHLQNVTPTPSP